MQRVLGSRAVATVLKLLGLTVALALAGCDSQGEARTDATAFINGRWFNGQEFVEGTWYSVNGVLTAQRPAPGAAEVDLDGGYVVPPFADAHNHNVSDDNPGILDRYVEAGVFYVKNPNNLPRLATAMREVVKEKTTIDVMFAGGSLTAPGGHPIEIVQRNIERGVWTEADGEGGFYYAIDTRADLDAKWNAILTTQPDFIKTYLLYSEEYERRKDNPAFFGWKGLNPALLPEIVQRAHQAGLRVSTHVESAEDFHHAVVAGVDEINHMPGFRPTEEVLQRGDLSLYVIAEGDVQAAAQQGTVVVTTLGSFISLILDNPDHPLAEPARDLIVGNLRRLHAAGVPVALGSDELEQVGVEEALLLHRLGVFDPVTLLRLWCETTPRTIFPDRNIGRLADGYEASFLVLGGNPLADFEAVRQVRVRVKEGVVL